MDAAGNGAGDHGGAGGVAVQVLLVLAALGAVFGLAALALAWGNGPTQVAALVVAVAAAAGGLVRAVRIRRAGPQWGPPAATEDPRPQTTGPTNRPDREQDGSRDRSVTECSDVTALLSTSSMPPRAEGAPSKPMTTADTGSTEWPVGRAHRRPDRRRSTGRTPAGQ